MYGASDKEQELNDLNDLHDRICSLSEEVDDIFSDIDEKYGFGIVDRLQDMALEVKEKRKNSGTRRAVRITFWIGRGCDGRTGQVHN